MFPSLPEGEGSWLDHGFCDSALRPRRMTGMLAPIIFLVIQIDFRMTALLEGSKNQMGMMGGFSPVLVKQIYLRLPTAIRIQVTNGLRGNVFVHFRSHHVRSCRICWISCKQNDTFIKWVVHQVLTDSSQRRKNTVLVSRMSFCTKGIIKLPSCPTVLSCRIQLFQKAEKNLLPWGEGARQGG